MFLGQTKGLFLLLCLLLICSTINGRQFGRRRFKEQQHLRKTRPLQRSVDDPDPVADSDSHHDSEAITGTGAGTGTTPTADLSNETESPTKHPEPIKGQAGDSSRTFKHLLIMKGLLGHAGWGGGGGGSGSGGGSGVSNFMLPYIIINNPTNVSNINDNQLTNISTVPNQPDAPVTPTPPPGPAAFQRHSRKSRVSSKNRKQLQMHMQTPMYQQRKNNFPSMMLGLNSRIIPILTASQLRHFDGGVRRNGGGGGGGRRRQIMRMNNNAYSNNPFTMLANSLKGIRYL